MQQSALTQRRQYDREDGELLKRIQRTDQRALATLYDRYAPIIYPLGLRMTGLQDAAENLVHDVFAHVWEKSGTYAAQHGSVYSWIVLVSRAKVMEKMRSSQQRRRGQGEDRPQPRNAPAREEAEATDTPVAMKGFTEEVRAVVRSFSKLELRLLELSYFEGQSQSDLARMLRIPLGTIKAKMRRGIQRLRQTVSSREERS